MAAGPRGQALNKDESGMVVLGDPWVEETAEDALEVDSGGGCIFIPQSEGTACDLTAALDQRKSTPPAQEVGSPRELSA